MKLNDNFDRMLDAYCALTGADKSPKVITSCGFCEKVSNANGEAVIALPCGFGKSTWAYAHIAANASDENPYIYVVATRTEAVMASVLLGQMRACNDVGLHLGWNAEACQQLSGRKLTFDRCLRNSSKSACRRCKVRRRCIYHQSLKALRRPVVTITRESFIILCEKGHCFRRQSIICDEELQVFSDERFTLMDLRDIDTVFNAASDERVCSLVGSILPSINLWRSTVPDTAAHNMRLDAGTIHGVAAKIIRYVRRAPLNPKTEKLVFRFLGFIRTAAECNATYAYRCDGNEVFVKKNRIDLSNYTSYRKFIVLNATAALSMVRLSGRAKIWKCKDLEKYRNEGKVRLYVIPANPTKSRVKCNTDAGKELLKEHRDSIFACDGSMVLLACNREDGGLAERLEAELAAEYATMVFKLSRGLLRGTNIAKACTVAFLPSAGFFTTLTDCALHAALETGKDFPWSEVVDSSGNPRMDRGRFINPVLQEIYMKKTIAEFYQGIYRTAIRDGHDVNVILPLPDADWVTALWDLAPFEIMAVHGGDGRKQRLFKGVAQLLGITGGTLVLKVEVALSLGYSGRQAWKRNRGAILSLIGKYFVEKGRFLIRRGFSR